MNQKILAQFRNKHFRFKKICVFFSFIVITFCTQSSLFAQAMGNKGSNAQDSLTSITIHQEINFKAGPQRLYEILLSSKEFSDCTKKSFSGFSATSAVIDPKEGGAFSLFDGHIVGRILELLPNQRIVEAWRVVDWPAGIYSIARFEFKVQGTGTQLIFDHIGFPEGLKQHLSIGWQEHYWDAFAKYLE